jgi:ATP-dependent Clp protease protease subunit
MKKEPDFNEYTEFLFGEIDDQKIESIIKWIVRSQKQKITEPLTLYINSVGGSVPDSFALIDMMRTSAHPIKTIALGSICSSAFLIFSSGTKGQRIVSKNASIMCHQYSFESDAKYHDLKAQFREIELINNRMINLIANNSNLSTKVIKSKLLSPTDSWLTAEELVEYGIADAIF